MPSLSLSVSLDIYILQRGVQWKQGVVVYMTLYTSLLCNTTPIHCTPHALHPPLQSIQDRGLGSCGGSPRIRKEVLRELFNLIIVTDTGLLVCIYYTFLYYTILCYAMLYYIMIYCTILTYSSTIYSNIIYYNILIHIQITGTYFGTPHML